MKDNLAIISFVLGLLFMILPLSMIFIIFLPVILISIFFIALITGIISIISIRKYKTSGLWLAICGIIFSLIGVLIILLFYSLLSFK